MPDLYLKPLLPHCLSQIFSKLVLLTCLTLASPFALAQTIQLKTENYPPFNMSGEQDSIIGVSTEIVEELFKRAEIDYELELLPWQRAFSMALEEANTAVFSTTRTEERESKFKWVGPIAENNWVFLAKASRSLSVSNLEEAKSLRVGGYQGDAIALFLADQGFDLDLAPCWQPLGQGDGEEPVFEMGPDPFSVEGDRDSNFTLEGSECNFHSEQSTRVGF
jgi:ABC-type amino acid transport substrate-binding protein